MPEAFLSADVVLNLLLNLTSGLIVNSHIIDMNLSRELPFQITEPLLMRLVSNHGFSRQETHEKIRQLSLEAAKRLKEGALENPLFDMIEKDEFFNNVHETVKELKDATKFTGRAAEMTRVFCEGEVMDSVRKWGIEAKVGEAKIVV